MKRKLLPQGRSNRLFFWYFAAVTIVAWTMVLVSNVVGGSVTWQRSLLLSVAGPVGLLITYLLQTRQDKTDPYADIIANMAKMSGDLKALGDFLQREQSKVAESQTSLRKLQEEGAQLHAVVKADREVVKALFATRQARIAVWKERGFGFISGCVTSLITPSLFEFIRAMFMGH